MYMCVYICEYVYSYTYILKPCSLRGPGRGDTPIAISIPNTSIWFLNAVYY